MHINRFFNLVVIVALAIVAALTISQAAAADQLAAVNSSTANLCSTPDLNHSSIHMVYVDRLERWMTYTDNGPTGVDGGLAQLLNDRRFCSK
jgi:hypothetical protein